MLADLERKISVRTPREELIRRGVLKEVDSYEPCNDDSFVEESGPDLTSVEVCPGAAGVSEGGAELPTPTQDQGKKIC